MDIFTATKYWRMTSKWLIGVRRTLYMLYGALWFHFILVSFCLCSEWSAQTIMRDFMRLLNSRNGARDKDIHRKLSAAFPDAAPGYSTVSLWCKQFRKHSRMSWSDMTRLGRPRTSHTQENWKNRTLLEQNLKYSCRALGEELVISKRLFSCSNKY